MRGVGEASGAISILNALFTGVGCAAAVDLPVHVEVELEPGRAGSPGLRVEPATSDTPLVRSCFEDAVRRHAPPGSWTAQLRIDSSVPAAVGLKSSSAVSVAVALGVSLAFGGAGSPEGEARATAQVARATGQSATGAFDDALAAAEGGLVLTDNRSDFVVARANPDPSWVAVLWIPPGTHLPSPQWSERFRQHAAGAEPAVEAARRGDWLEAMRRNGELLELVLGRRSGEIRRRAERAGALAASVSGLGPAVTFVTSLDRAEEVRRSLGGEDGDVRIVRFRYGTQGADPAP